jgi:ubiquinone/menaquinone biosynthesis C-methylase UbiE
MKHRSGGKMGLLQSALMVGQQMYHWNFRRIEECSTLIDWLEPHQGERVLDVGCGDGFYDAKIADTGARVVGIDIHSSRLGFAQRINKNDLTEFHYMDAEQMGFAENSFDKAISFCVVEHFHQDEKVMEHVSRVLKPGGRFVLSADSLSNPEVTQAERDAHQKRYAVNTFYTESILRDKLWRAGFELEDAHYILTTPFTLALARLSWKLDDLPKALAFVTLAGYIALGTVGKAASDYSERTGRRRDSGLTLLAKAKKRQ